MEAKSALVRTDRAVKLNTEAAVDHNSAVVGCPRNAELDNSLGLDHTLKHTACNVLGALLYNGLDGLEHLAYCLMKFGLTGISLDDSFHKLIKIF